MNPDRVKEIKAKMTERRTNRSYVSYMDKSRNYYAAHGYPNPYGWAHHEDVPFTALKKPLAECRIALATTADRAPRAEGRQVRLYAEPLASAKHLHTEMSWDRTATHMQDSETYLPLAAIERYVDEGRLGSVSPRFYGVPTEYSHRRTMEEDAPKIAAWMLEDGVDVCVLASI